jgi:hypothetical protein
LVVDAGRRLKAHAYPAAVEVRRSCRRDAASARDRGGQLVVTIRQ